MSGAPQVLLNESDFNDGDAAMISALKQMFPLPMIRQSGIVEIDNQ